MSGAECNSNDTSTSVVKLVTLGDVGTGKTTLCQAMCGTVNEAATAPTLGLDFWSKLVHHNHARIRLNAYDTSGQERFEALTPSYLRTADVVLLVLSCTSHDKDMAHQLKKWHDMARNNVSAGARYIVAITKRDLVDGTLIAGPKTANQLVRCGLSRYHVVTGKHGFDGAGVHGLWDDVVQAVISCCAERSTQRRQPLSVQVPRYRNTTSTVNNNENMSCLPWRRLHFDCC